MKISADVRELLGRVVCEAIGKGKQRDELIRMLTRALDWLDAHTDASYERQLDAVYFFGQGAEDFRVVDSLKSYRKSRSPFDYRDLSGKTVLCRPARQGKIQTVQVEYRVL
jgi:hypothetical protein